MKAVNRRMWLSALLLAATAGLAHAQGFGGAGTGAHDNSAISSSGTAIIKRQPDILRMQVELSAKGKTLKEALGKLTTQREAALARLEKLGAEKEAIKAADPRISTISNDRQRQMDMMVRQRMRAGARKSKKAPEKPPVTVTATLTAEWKLKAKGTEAILLEAQTVEDAVRAAELAGKEGADGKSAEDEEAAEEMNEEMMVMNDDPNMPKPGEPFFMFVAKISSQERRQALMTAFAKATANAEQLGAAAGMKLGPLQSITGQSSPGYQNYNASYGRRYGGRDYIMQQMLEEQENTDSGEIRTEAIGSQPGEVVLPIVVSVSFGLAKAAAK